MNFMALIILLVIMLFIVGFFFVVAPNPIVGGYFVIGLIYLYFLGKDDVEKN